MRINAPPHTGGTIAILCGRIYDRVSALPAKFVSPASNWACCDQRHVRQPIANKAANLPQHDGAETQGPVQTDRRGAQASASDTKGNTQ